MDGKGEPMEWIVEAETLSDFVDNGRYAIASKPLVRCRDCRKRRTLKCPFGIMKWDAPDADGYCYKAERRTNGEEAGEAKA